MGVTHDGDTVQVSADRLDRIEARQDELERENDELREENNELRERQDRIERENDELREHVADLEETDDNLRRSLAEAKGLINSLKDRVDGSLGDDLRERIDSVEETVSSVRDTTKWVVGELNDLKDRLSGEGDLAAEASDAAADAGHGVTPETPLENVVALPEHSATDHLSENRVRARWIASQALELSEKSRAGRTIHAGRIRRALAAADRDARGETVRRIFRFLDELGESDTTVKKQNGRRLVVFHGDSAERLAELSNAVVTR